MGQHLIIRCRNCMKYRGVGKYHPENTAERNGEMPDTLARFCHEHMGHELELVGEYGGTQERWMETVGCGEWTKHPRGE